MLTGVFRTMNRNSWPRLFTILGACLVVLGSMLIGVAAAPGQSSTDAPHFSIKYPEAKRTQDEDTYHGVTVADPYRWLENPNAPEVKDWIREEKSITAGQEGSLPSFEPFRERIRQIQDFRTLWPPMQAGKELIFIETPGNLGGSSAGGLSVYVQHSASDPPQVLLDSKKVLPDRELKLGRSIQADKDGRLLAYSMSKTGSQWLQWKIVNIETGHDLPEVLLGGNTRMPTIAWAPNGRGFYYGRFHEPQPDIPTDAKVEFEKVYFHRVGTPQSSDQLIIENAQEADRWFLPSVSEDGEQLVITSARGSSSNEDVFLKRLGGNAKEFENLNSGMSGQFHFLGNKGPQFYFLTNWNAPRQKIVSVRIDLPREKAWEAVVAEDSDVITHANLVADRFVLQCSKDAAPVFKVFALNGVLSREIKMPTLGNVWGYPWGPGFTGARTDPVTFFSLTGMADPGSIYRLDPQSGELSLWKRPQLRFDPDQFVTEHAVFSSKDGTHVPIFIVHKKGLKQNGENPTWLYAYGALGWSSFPWFQPHMVAWVEKGGVFALAGIRGGGEYGEAWHQAGIKTNREHAIEDYISAAEWLVHSGYTSNKKLVANGGSLSGSLPAVALVRRPDLFASIVIDFPVLDLVRYSQHTGALMWLAELGSVDNPAELQELLNYSPFHNLKAGQCYPPTIIEAGTHDETAVPSHAYKFAAALQAAQGCRENPIFLLAVEGAGHGFGATAEQAADTTAFELAFVTKAITSPINSKPEPGTAQSQSLAPIKSN